MVRHIFRLTDILGANAAAKKVYMSEWRSAKRAAKAGDVCIVSRFETVSDTCGGEKACRRK